MGDIQDIKPVKIIKAKQNRPAPAVEVAEDGTVTQGDETYGSSS